MFIVYNPHNHPAISPASARPPRALVTTLDDLITCAIAQDSDILVAVYEAGELTAHPQADEFISLFGDELPVPIYE